MMMMILIYLICLLPVDLTLLARASTDIHASWPLLLSRWLSGRQSWDSCHKSRQAGRRSAADRHDDEGLFTGRSENPRAAECKPHGKQRLPHNQTRSGSRQKKIRQAGRQ